MSEANYEAAFKEMKNRADMLGMELGEMLEQKMQWRARALMAEKAYNEAVQPPQSAPNQEPLESPSEE